MIKICLVTIFNTTHDYFDYLPPSVPIAIGMRVKVSLRGKSCIGIVTGICEKKQSHYQLKTIDDVIDDTPIIPEDILSLARWAAHYYHSPLSEAIKNILPKRLREGKPFSFTKNATFPLSPLPPVPAPSLNEEQAHAVKTISQSLDHFHPFLLFGITGSGKTEVYCQVMTTILERGKQVLLIVPEIGLTPQLSERMAQRFDVPIALLHSRLNDSERLNNWLYAYHQKASIVIGTRSAIFAPLPKLGLIIIDESHDMSFKQQEGMRYSARDLALKRAQQQHVPIILGSATPSLESLKNVVDKKYTLLRLSHRAQTQTSNHFKIVDLRNKPLFDGFCDVTLNRIDAVLNENKQVMVFINRRGYAPVLLCHQCAWITDCPRCTAHLTFHQKEQTVHCHHCGFHRPKPSKCEACKESTLIPIGAGTERVSDFLAKHFPHKRVHRIDKDTTSKKESLNQILQAIHAGEYDILVGTQLLAKGHHFPRLKLVVILDADSGFFSHDFRAIERLGQQITQVSGRAGRTDRGEVLIQTHQPDNPYLLTLIQSGYHTFANTLLKDRDRFNLPPYSYMAMIRTKGRNLDKLFTFLNHYKTLLLSFNPSLVILGPAPAPMLKKAGLYHAQLLIKALNRPVLSEALTHCHKEISTDRTLKNTRYVIDVDPQELS